ncbi:MAG: VWA domain-containing protein [Vicinamibacterales bacterium]
MRSSAAVVLGWCLVAAWTAAPASQPQEPRFRGGTNLVRLDVYASADGAPVTDLTAADFEVFEDGVRQEVTSFEFIRARGAVPDTARVEPTSVAESRARAAQPDTRLFVLFLDTLHVQVEGSFHAQGPVGTLLDRLVGENDLVGVMTPDLPARAVTFSPRTSSVTRLLTSNWTWGQRGRTTDPQEQVIEQCYADNGSTAGLAKALIERRREARTLDALADLIRYLEGTREERSFVLLLTEGWLTPGPDEFLGRAITMGGRRVVPGGPDPLGLTPDGRLTLDTNASLDTCERERSLLARRDLDRDYQQLMRTANRANVSFYPIDPRGLVVFDDPIGPARPSTPVQDSRRLSSRQDHLRELALETDGEVVLNTNIDRALPKLLTDIGSYYLLGYVSTNQKLDGKYRRLTVKVTRPGVSTRSRPGYVAPTEAEVTAAAAPAETRREAPDEVARALARLPGGRAPTALVVDAVGGPGSLRIALEIDRATAASAEWAKGATAQVVVMDEAGARTGDPAAVTLGPGARVALVEHAAPALAPGRYKVRVEATPDGGTVPLTAVAEAAVPGAGALLGPTSLAFRWGPSTGRRVEPTADPRFRRTERLITETAVLVEGAVLDAHLLNRLGQAVEIPVKIAERLDEASHARTAVAEVTLAPLAAGEYVLAVGATRGSTTEHAHYAIRVVP